MARFALVTFLLLCMFLPSHGRTQETHGSPLRVYASGEAALLRPLLGMFTQQTGIQTELTADTPAKLIARMKHDEASRPADVILFDDAVSLEMAKKEGLLHAAISETLYEHVPEKFRDPQGYWYGFAYHARLLAYAGNRVNASELFSYEDLADPLWRGKLLMTSFNRAHNATFLASFVRAHGEPGAERLVYHLLQNLAQPPLGDDAAVIRALAARTGDVAFVRSDALARMLLSDNATDRAAAALVGVVVPNQRRFSEMSRRSPAELRGAFVNLLGGAVTRDTQQREKAVRLLEFLSGAEAQHYLKNTLLLFPVRRHAAKPLPSVLAPWLRRMQTDHSFVADLHAYYTAALKVADRSGWK